MNYKRYLVELIKQAQAQDDTLGDPTAIPATVPAAPVAAPASTGAPQIKKMQQSLIKLAQSVTAQINVQNVASDNQQEQGEATSRDSFNNFITKHFMRNSDVQGQEFDSDPNKTQMSQKNPSQPTRMGNVMDTMSRIGNPKTGEMVVDGKWGPRTNAALHNAYAFAYSMLKLSESFQAPVTAYDQPSLAEFKGLIPADEEVTPVRRVSADVIKNAMDITQHLQAIEKMYGEVKANILEKPEYQTYIEGDTPFTSYKKSGPSFTQQEKQMFDQLASGNQQYNKTFQVFVPAPKQPAPKTAQVAPSAGPALNDVPRPQTPYTYNASGEGANITITLADLVSSDAFTKWYQSPAANAIRGVDTMTLFNAIRQAIQKTVQIGAA